jgi:KaiC/GvpD/RAD55 family RecA-like ATPase
MTGSEGRESFVFVTGAPGTGKSALLDEFAQCRRQAGDIVVVVTFNSTIMDLSASQAAVLPGPFTEFLLRFIFS